MKPESKNMGTEQNKIFIEDWDTSQKNQSRRKSIDVNNDSKNKKSIL